MADEQIRLAPAADEAYRAFLPASLALAVLLGFALGLHITISRLVGGGSPERNADLIQAHGQVQLLGFTGLFIMGMSLRLLPRFTGGRVGFPSLVPFILILLVPALIVRAVVLPLLSGDLHDAVLLTVHTAYFIVASLFLFVIVATAAQGQEEGTSAGAFIAGGCFLTAAALVGLIEAIRTVEDGRRTLSLLGNNAMLQLLLSGFVVSSIFAVSTRAIPVLTATPRPSEAEAAAVLKALIVAVTGLAAGLLALDRQPRSEVAAGVAAFSFALLGATFLVISWQSGALHSLRNRLRPASQPHLWLVRSAFAWLAIAGVIAIVSGVTALIDLRAPPQHEFDAVRHALGLGVVTNLIAGMSLMIVPELAVQRQQHDQSGLARALFILITVATLLRVLPALAGDTWTYDQRNLSMAVAGALGEIAVVTFSFTLLRAFLGRPRYLRGGA